MNIKTAQSFATTLGDPSLDYSCYNPAAAAAVAEVNVQAAYSSAMLLSAEQVLLGRFSIIRTPGWRFSCVTPAGASTY